MGNFREHGLMLYLCPELQIAHVKLQADRELGRSYAGLLAIVEGFRSLGYLSNEDYEVLKARYSKPLAEDKPLTLEQVKEKELFEKKQRYFSNLVDQWAEHTNPEWRAKKFAEAAEWKDKIPNAKLVLALAEEAS